MSSIAYTGAMWERLAEYLSNFVHLFKFWTVVHAYERGLVLRFGVLHRELEPGLHWLAPLAVEESLQLIVTSRPLTVSVSAHTLDDIQVEAELVVTFEVSELETFLLDQDHEHGPAAAASALLGRHIRAELWEALGTAEASERLLCASTEAFEQLGLTVVSADLAALTRVKTIRVRGLRS